VCIAQFVNAPGSAKALLRITSVDDATFQFQFSPSAASGLDAQGERDRFKDALAQALVAQRSAPESRAPTPPIDMSLPPARPLSKEEIRRRQQILSSDPDLRRLHRELVVGRQISEEEFWETRKVRNYLYAS
jgi:hypothetical protein